MSRHALYTAVKERTGLAFQEFCKHPYAPTDLLVGAAALVPNAGPGSWLKAVLARNPGMPLEGLKILMESRPTSVAQNPKFKLLLAADPAFLDGCSVQAKAGLVRFSEGEPRLIRRLAASNRSPTEIRISAAQNPCCPPDILERYHHHALAVRVALARNSALSPSAQWRLAADKLAVRTSLATNPHLISALFERLSIRGEDESVHIALVNNFNVPDSALVWLNAVGSAEVKNQINRRWGKRIVQGAKS